MAKLQKLRFCHSLFRFILGNMNFPTLARGIEGYFGAKARRCLAFRLPAIFIKLHGDCSFIDNPDFSYVEVKNKLDGLNDKLNIFGWSLGSLFALKWTLDNPD